jgi:Transposase
MRLTEYGRPPQKRKAYVPQSALLLVGVDVSNAQHSAGIGTQPGISCRNLAFPHTREGCQRFAHPLRHHLDKNQCRRVLMAMEPSGLYGQALEERRKDSGSGVCLVPCPAVRNHRKPMPAGTRKTAATDADSLFDLLQQGTCFLPVARAAALQAASRWRQRPMALQNRVGPLRNPRRAASHLAFPALHPLLKDLTPPTAWRFLQAKPPPASSLRHGRTRFLEQWPPRQRCGQWRPATFHRL